MTTSAKERAARVADRVKRNARKLADKAHENRDQIGRSIQLACASTAGKIAARIRGLR